jgi:2-polyprenyl-6-methoxyphenol hydroxylase-like FAD-dependent oxidoreductase
MVRSIPMIRDVVIVGGGPTGLMLACELRLAGVAVTMLERLAEPDGLSKSLDLGSRAIDLLDYRGLLGRFRDRAQSFSPAAVAVGWTPQDLTGLKRDHAKLLVIEQARVEELLEERAIELGAALRWGHTPLGLELDRDGLRLEVRDPNGDYQLVTRFLVGCDGEQDVVRALCRRAGLPETECDRPRRVFLVGGSAFDADLQDTVSLGRRLAAEVCAAHSQQQNYQAHIA